MAGASVLAISPVSADETAEPPPETVGVPNSGQDVATVEAYTYEGAYLGSGTYDAAGNLIAGQDVAARRSYSGCNKVTVQNETETTLGYTAFWYNTYTDWCWLNTGVDVRATGQYFSDVDPNFIYRELTAHEEYYYDWGPGPISGHRHFRQTHWENCVVHYGCISNLYPWNRINVHNNGDYTWNTGG